MKAAYFVPNAKRNIAATAWASGNTPKGIPLGALTARSAAFLFICQNIKSMKNFKKALENQKQVNEAITSIVNYFEQCPYSSCVEYFAEAQTQILKMVKFLQYYDIGKRPSEQAFSEVDMEDLILFMMQVQEYLKLLKPFTNQSEDEQ